MRRLPRRALRTARDRALQTWCRFFGLNWKDDRPLAIQWFKELGNPYKECAFDSDGRVAIDWGVYGAPETFLVDGNGVVIHKHIAPLTEAIWERDFMPLIRARQGTSP